MDEPVGAALLERYREQTEVDDTVIEAALAQVLGEAARSRPSAIDRAAARRRRRLAIVPAAAASLLLLVGSAMAANRILELSPRAADAFQAGFAVAGQMRDRIESTGRPQDAEPPPALDTPIDAPRADWAGASERAPADIEPIEPAEQVEPVEPVEQVEPVEPVADPDVASAVDESARPSKLAAAAKDPKAETPADAPSQPSTANLSEESRLLRKARGALAAENFASARAWAEEHGERFPDGFLTEERLIVLAVAGCRGGQVDAGRGALRELERQFGRASVTAEVEAACRDD